MHRCFDAYNAQLELAAWYLGSGGVEYCATALGHISEHDQHTSEETAQEFSAGESNDLLAADTYYVTAEMGLLIRVASSNIPDDILTLSDLPSTKGFVYFESPFTVRTSTLDGLQGIQIRALKWDQSTIVQWDSQPGRPGILIQAYAETSSWPYIAHKFEEMDLPSLVPAWISEDQWLCDLPWQGLTWDNPQPSPDNPVFEIQPDLAALRRILLSTFRLAMHKKTATIDRQHLDRPTARRAARQGAEPPDDILIIRLRRESRPAGEPEPTDTTVDWSHRWIVKGFWRNQWYPSLKLHKRIWIYEYVKGPANKPIVVRDRIYSLER